MKNRFNPDRKYFKIAVYAFFVIAAAILFEKILANTGNIAYAATSFFALAAKLASPLIIGFCIAYLFNPLVAFFERKLLSKAEITPKLVRMLSIAASYVIIFGCSLWLLAYLVPEIAVNVSNFINSLQYNVKELETTANDFFNKISFVESEDVVAFLRKVFNPMLEYAKEMSSAAQLSSYLKSFAEGTAVAASGFINGLLGIIISFYMLYDKEAFSATAKKTVRAVLRADTAEKVISSALDINNIFKSFIIGKTIDSVIIGILCFIIMAAISAPYALLISVIVGVTNMIPYFGPFIGAVPSVLIVLLVSPGKALLVALMIFLLQQFDGIILGPKLLGMSVGLSPIWIIFSITVGGYFGGPLGMFLGVPVFAAFKKFLNVFIDKKYNEKYPQKEFPTNQGLPEEDEDAQS